MAGIKRSINYKNLVPRKNGFVFKFLKKGHHFIHTFIEGDFLDKVGICATDVVGHTLYDFLPEDSANQKHMYYDMAWNGETVNYEGSLNGSYYVACLSPIIINSSTIEVNGTAIDITIEKKNDMKVHEMEKLSMVGELAAGIAHEIRNPLTSITGFAQILKETMNDVPTKEYLDIMLSELDRINKIVNEFMFLAKPRDTIEFKETDIKELIVNVVKFMEPQSNIKSVKVNTVLESSITALCDPNQIKQVLINVIQNALEATLETNKNIDLILKAGSENNYVIQIIDNGSGISEERQKTLFEPFYTTKEKGTGLGLMICKRIIENHHGTIEVESKPNRGTAVTISLPKYGEFHSIKA
ncbi:ATP-binding protein [Bacillus sp. V5-8f]|uniref:ATP-binding protein n=1 Tax=Bacillus sp. V5-8f TaxID=2053044 RepID=UPI000C76C398|nr:ATP-binding protein [Bacillus sp. V5-8f]PLT32086.1 PAS domain-containing sensor histidine kinase [Bacillus sp. V5-8f]